MYIGIIALLFCLNSAVLGGGGNDFDHTTSNNGATGKPLVFSTILFEPYLMENPDKEATGNERYIGFIADLVKELATRLKFNYELRLVADGKWGSRDQHTGHWTGMIGEVTRGERDMAVAPITITDIRKSVVDFTVVWQDVSLTALVSSESEIRSLDDLLRSNYTIGTLEGGSTAQALMGSRDPKISALWSRIVSQRGMVQSVEAGWKRSREGNYAMIIEKPMGDYIKARECGLLTVGDFLPQKGYAFPAPRGFQMLNSFNQALAKMKRDGKIEEFVDRWWNPPQICGACANALISLATLLFGLIASKLL